MSTTNEERMSTTEESSGLTLGKAAGKAALSSGKVALTVACPPLGLASIVKEGKVVSFAAGTVMTAAFNVATGLGLEINFGKKVYDSPTIAHTYSTTYSNPLKFMAGALLSPFYFHSQFNFNTNIERSDGGSSFVVGTDVVNFDSERGVYALNFEPERQFVDSERDIVSLAEAEQRVTDLTSQGDLMLARSARLEEERVGKEYKELRGLFEDAVSKMNSELTTLASASTEDK